MTLEEWFEKTCCHGAAYGITLNGRTDDNKLMICLKPSIPDYPIVLVVVDGDHCKIIKEYTGK